MRPAARRVIGRTRVRQDIERTNGSEAGSSVASGCREKAPSRASVSWGLTDDGDEVMEVEGATEKAV